MSKYQTRKGLKTFRYYPEMKQEALKGCSRGVAWGKLDLGRPERVFQDRRRSGDGCLEAKTS